MKSFKGRIGGVKVGLLCGLAAAAVAYAGYRVFFNRGGEAAVALIPADATCVITLDTHPSENQVGAFAKLAGALKREGLDQDMEDGVSGLIGKAGLAKEVRQYLTKDLASAWWTGANGRNTTGIALLSVSDSGAVARAISSGTPVTGAGVPAYSFGPGAVMAVVGNYLAISGDAATISRVVATENGAPSIAGLPEYNAARAALPADANLMVFASPAGISQLMSQKGSKTTMWMSFGASLRDGGIQFDYRGPVDAKTYPGLGDLSTMQPLDQNLLKKLPPGAYGLIAHSSLDKYLSAMKTGLGQVSGHEAFDKGQEGFEKETGLSVEKDILPAFKGDAVLAIYPDAAGSTKSADGLLLVDNAHGGTPEVLAGKVRAYMERKSAEDGAKNNKPAMHFVERQLGHVTVWSLDETSAQEMRKSLGGDANGPKGSAKPNDIFEDKNVEYGISNGSIIVATSPAMMNKAMLALNGDRSLADDPAFAEMNSHVDPKDQMMIMCSLSRIAQRFSAELLESTKNTGFTPDDVINLFGGPNTGLVGSCRCVDNTVTGSTFLPLDFDRMAKLIAAEKRGTGKPSQSQFPGSGSPIPPP